MAKMYIALVVQFLLMSIPSYAATYEFRADQFSLGGVVEEFDSASNTFSPWIGGTVIYQDGYAVFTDPGVLISPAGVTWSHEFSGIAYQARETGETDFVAQSIWDSEYLPQAPAGAFGQYFFDSTGVAVAVAMTNNSQEFADLSGYSAGLGFAISRNSGDGTLLDLQTVAINNSDIIGDIAIMLAFDAENGMIEGLYSLDSGESFSSLGGYTSTGNGRHVLFGDPVVLSTIPIPAAAWLFGSALLGLITVARRKRLKA